MIPSHNGIVVTIRYDSIFASNNLVGFMGKTFSIFMFFPSKLMEEFVIEVKNDVIETNRKIYILLFFNNISFVIFIPSIFVKIFIIPSILIVMYKTINKYSTRAKPAFIIKTGVLKNVDSSFFINEYL